MRSTAIGVLCPTPFFEADHPFSRKWVWTPCHWRHHSKHNT